MGTGMGGSLSAFYSKDTERPEILILSSKIRVLARATHLASWMLLAQRVALEFFGILETEFFIASDFFVWYAFIS